MKRLATTIFLFLYLTGDGQHREASGDLLYSDQALARLKSEISVKNEGFKALPPGKAIYAIPQGTAIIFSAEGTKADEAKSMLEAGISLKQFAGRFSDIKKGNELLFYKIRHDSDTKVEFRAVTFGTRQANSVYSGKMRTYEEDMSGRWVYNYHPGNRHGKSRLTAMYIKQEIKRTALPQQAAFCINYADHLIDTNTMIYAENAVRTGWRIAGKEYGPVADFMQLTRDFPGRPSPPEKQDRETFMVFRKQLAEWEEKRAQWLDRKMKEDPGFKELLLKACKAALNGEGRSYRMEEFESYVEQYISPETALDLKRRRKVTGSCSMDPGPINHAYHIARLAGETCCMEIFLRAHLNILYDRFERVTDGSYAEPERLTYGKELEVIGIDMKELIPGTLLRGINLSSNHYYGDVNRAGRAMAELSRRQEIYSGIEELIGHPRLDLFNKCMLVFLARSYNHHLWQKGQKEEAGLNLSKLRELLTTFPVYLRDPLQHSVTVMFE